MLTDLFGEHPDVRILEFLANHLEFDYTISEIARNAGVSRPATYKVVDRFLASGVLVRTRRVGGSWFFRLSANHALVRPFLDMEIGEPPSALPARRRAPPRGESARRR
ncbi:MAG: winged helix-turn-helix domain-containing protein [Thermoplasmatota archaeon]